MSQLTISQLAISQLSKDTRYSKGVGIIEVLIALVLVSFGVLGMAGLQLTGMKHSAGGYNRSRATLYAENITARMRTNQAGIDNFSYASFDSNNVNCATKPDPYCQAYKGVVAETCSSAEMAAFDFYSIACGDWTSSGSSNDGILTDLVNGRLQVSCEDSPCVANSNYTILIGWEESLGQDGTETSVSGKRVQIRFNP